MQYLVKWKGYPESNNQWLKWQDVNAPDLIVEYQKENPDTITHIKRGWNCNESIAILASSSLSAIADFIAPHLTAMSNEPCTTSVFPGSTTQTRGHHLALYDTAATQIDNPTDGAAVIRRIMDLTQDTVADRATEVGKGTPDDLDRATRMDADTNGRPNTDGTKVDETNLQTHIRHATLTTTTKGLTGSNIMPINVDTLEPGSPESPIYVDTFDHTPSPKSQ